MLYFLFVLCVFFSLRVFSCRWRRWNLVQNRNTRRHFHRQQLDFAEWWDPTVTWADPNNWLAHYPNAILSLCETLRYLGCSNLLFHRGLYCRINLRVLTNLITNMLHCLNTADFVHNPVMSLNVIYFKGDILSSFSGSYFCFGLLLENVYAFTFKKCFIFFILSA